MKTRHAWVLAAVLLACGETGQERVQVRVSARGSQSTGVVLEAASFVLTRAEIAFGPVYLCASELAETELCEVAVAELTEAVLIDGLDPAAQALGELDATTGTVHSAMYDYGISWLVTEQAPRTDPGVEASAILEGSVARAGVSLSFWAQVDVNPGTRGSLAMNAQRTEHTVGAGDALTLAVDPYAWLRGIDVDELFLLDADADGKVMIEPGTQAYEAILQGMQARAPVTFEWE